jgi:hypothetical protein
MEGEETLSGKVIQVLFYAFDLKTERAGFPQPPVDAIPRRVL